MIRIILNQSAVESLNVADEVAEVCDGSGQLVGYFYPANPQKIESPYSDEELERFAQEPGGRSLQEILRDLEARS